MMLNEKPKEQKGKMVKIPISHKSHMLLHAVKILHGRNISDTVDAALEEYFDHHPEIVRAAKSRLEGA